MSQGRVKEYWLGYRLEDTGSVPGRDMDSFTSPTRPDRSWVPISFLFNGYRGLFPLG